MPIKAPAGSGKQSRQCWKIRFENYRGIGSKEGMSEITPPTYRAVIIGIGFIGAGDQVSGDAIGQQVAGLDGTHLAALSQNPRIKVTAGFSRDAGRRERFAQKTGCKAYSDWQEMIAQEKPDIISVANRANEHAEVTIGGAKGRKVKAIYCEKPVAQTIGDAERMLRACKKRNILLAFNHNRRFSPLFRRLRDFIAAGKLGELTSASARWPGGRLGCTGTHMIDTLCMLTGKKVAAVSGTLDLAHKPDCRGSEFWDPGAVGWMRMEGGLVIGLDGLDYARGPAEIIVNGALGRARTAGKDIVIEMWDGTQDRWTPPADTRTSMDRAVDEIVDALDGKAPFSYDAANAVHTLEAIVAFHASHARKSAWVDLPLKGAAKKIAVKTA